MTDQSQRVRTRFAPSPTGFLHIGGARTALFCYLYAKRMGGQFILRVEDTDQARSTEASKQAILQGLAWLGLDFDEGPYYQTERLARYQEVINELLAAKKAYRCICSKDRLDELRQQQMAAKQKPRYDGCCRDKNIPADAAECVVRFKNPQQGSVTFNDKVRGTISVSNSELDDLIIARSDGMPTYNLTVVVDDADMSITHVIRGDDHINNTPRQINLLQALGLPLPEYAHVPMILGADGKRLSKRHGAVSVMQYHDDGYLPEALLNYLVRLGWACGDQEVFDMQEMQSLFSLETVSKSPASFSEDKLLWLNQHYLKALPAERYLLALQDIFKQAGVNLENGPPLMAIIEMQNQRCKTLQEMYERSRYFFVEYENFEEKAARKHLKQDSLETLLQLKEGFMQQDSWQAPALHQIVIDVSTRLAVKLGKVAQPLRVALTGTSVSPPIDQTLLYIGRDRTIARLERAIDYIHLNGTNSA